MSHQRIDYEIIKTNVYLMGDGKERGSNLPNQSAVSILKDLKILSKLKNKQTKNQTMILYIDMLTQLHVDSL